MKHLIVNKESDLLEKATSISVLISQRVCYNNVKEGGIGCIKNRLFLIG